jgi:hypothetical protein
MNIIKSLCAAVPDDDLQCTYTLVSYFVPVFHMMIYDEHYKLLCASVLYDDL